MGGFRADFFHFLLELTDLLSAPKREKKRWMQVKI